MKVYKFRGLDNQIDFNHLKEIIETGKFWCSKFSDLNDPMEGVFTTSNKKYINKIYEGKGQFKICSFSGELGFKNPLMWGYYAKGFKGIALEVEIEENYEFSKIVYDDNWPKSDKTDFETIKKILLHKNKLWGHEDEYRFLKQIESGDNNLNIGKIKAIYFGSPYSNLVNFEQIINNTNHFDKYFEFKPQIIKISQEKGIKCFSIKIGKKEIAIGEEI